MTKITPNEIKIDPRIYPRKDIEPKKVEHLVEVLKAGNEFKDPIIVQRVKEAGEEKTILIDGAHRLAAYKDMNLDEIEVEHFMDEVLNFEDNFWDLRKESARTNQIHGLRLLKEDLKRFIRDYYVAHPESTQEDLRKLVNVSQATISNWTKDITMKIRMDVNSQIMKLYALGYKQEKIAKMIGISQSNVSINNGDINKHKNNIEKLLKKGYNIEEISWELKINEYLIWYIILNGKSDIDRMEQYSEFNRKPYTSDIWGEGFNILKDEEKGIFVNAPRTLQRRQAFFMNLLYYYTEQGDLVIDLYSNDEMGDACLIMNRKCLMYNQKEDYTDIGIEKLDPKEIEDKEDIPDEWRKVKMVFLSPFSSEPRKKDIQDDYRILASMDLSLRFLIDTDINYVAFHLPASKTMGYEISTALEPILKNYQYKFHREITLVRDGSDYTTEDEYNAMENKDPLPIVDKLLIFKRDLEEK